MTDAPSGNHDAVRILIHTNQNPKYIYVVARMICLTDLPASDAAIIGKSFTKEDIQSASSTPIIASVENIQSCQHSNSCNMYTISLSPRSWKYAAKGSRLQKKENWTFKPITNRLQAAQFAAGVVVLFQTIVYLRDTSMSGSSSSNNNNNSQYLCLGAIRSPGFIIGSTRHLRRIADGPQINKKSSAGPKKKRLSSGNYERQNNKSEVNQKSNLKGSITDEPLLKVPKYKN
jgi:hypothetical protein